jgi:hypothetical protein
LNLQPADYKSAALPLSYASVTVTGSYQKMRHQTAHITTATTASAQIN